MKIILNLITLALIFLVTACQNGSQSTKDDLATLFAVLNTPPLSISSPLPEPEPTPDTSDPLFIASLRQYQNNSPAQIELGAVLVESETFTQYEISYTSDGFRITGLMNVPHQNEFGEPVNPQDSLSQGLPVILLNHGHYAPSNYYPGKGTEHESAYLAEHGYVTLASDYRGYGVSEGSPGDHYDPGWTHDILNLVDALPGLSFVDPERVGIWGHSTGGEIGLQVITAREGIKALVLFGSLGADSAENLSAMLGTDEDRRDFAIQRYGLPEDTPDIWAKLSPLTYLPQVSTPISIHHGDFDHEVPPEFSAHLWQAMQDNGVPGEYYTYPDQGHFFAGSAWAEAMARSLAFFDLHLKD